jgi:hypothetical protein
MTLVWQPGYAGLDDPDAAAYITNVEAADLAAGQSGGLEDEVKLAIHDFVKGCKNDGIWPAIKASCILAGAKTLAGALIPLAGTAPTNNNFVSGDYNRKTGLMGDGSTKYLNSNRNNNADEAGNHHLSIFATRNRTDAFEILIGYRNTGNDTGGKFMGYRTPTNGTSFCSTPAADDNQAGSTVALNASTFHGLQRSDSAGYASRNSGITTNYTRTSTTAVSGNIFVFGLNNGGSLLLPTNARLAFYSIGESLPSKGGVTGLALLDTRVTALITAIGAAIP